MRVILFFLINICWVVSIFAGEIRIDSNYSTTKFIPVGGPDYDDPSFHPEKSNGWSAGLSYLYGLKNKLIVGVGYSHDYTSYIEGGTSGFDNNYNSCFVNVAYGWELGPRVMLEFGGMLAWGRFDFREKSNEIQKKFDHIKSVAGYFRTSYSLRLDKIINVLEVYGEIRMKYTDIDDFEYEGNSYSSDDFRIKGSVHVGVGVRF